MICKVFVRVCCLSLVMVTVHGYTTSPEVHPMFGKDGHLFRRQTAASGSGTREKHSITWKLSSASPIPIQSEIDLHRSKTLLRRGEFGALQGSRAFEVELECYEHGISFHQAISIRKQLMVRKMLRNSPMLKDKHTLKIITKRFEHGQTPLLELSNDYDLPPVSILRAIIGPRVLEANPRYSCLHTRRPAGRIVQSIINEACNENVDAFLSSWELQQLQTAKEHDVVSYDTKSTAAEDWEDIIYSYLDDQGINYITEESLRLHGYEDRGTPDCVLLDDLSINGKQIKWIEFKCFYASGLNENKYFTKNALLQQVEKYNAEFGPCGAVILKNGFSERISQRYPTTLFLDGGLLFPESELGP